MTLKDKIADLAFVTLALASIGSALILLAICARSLATDAYPRPEARVMILAREARP